MMKKHISLSLLMVAVLGLQTIPVVASEYAMQTLQQGRDLVSGGVKYVMQKGPGWVNQVSNLADQVQFGGITLKQAAKYLAVVAGGVLTLAAARALIKRSIKSKQKETQLPKSKVPKLHVNEAFKEEGIEHPTLEELALVGVFAGDNMSEIEKNYERIMRTKFKNIRPAALRAADAIARLPRAKELAQVLITSSSQPQATQKKSAKIGLLQEALEAGRSEWELERSQRPKLAEAISALKNVGITDPKWEEVELVRAFASADPMIVNLVNKYKKKPHPAIRPIVYSVLLGVTSEGTYPHEQAQILQELLKGSREFPKYFP